ncbi:hypothetical protein [Parendozoicomonas sp. Alg238-R29]|uniref:hypothetical protein n=1 Tax=Parendozoicomonas sp. Alg238-R29 TaxID=2993446 RepID=UPI00248E847E|nr:hypothetical protein [Parendozoicomonas sp. Alg238-R29]
MWRWFAVLAFCFGLYQWWSDRAVEHGPGVLVKEEPEQSRLYSSDPILHDGYKIQPLAEFSLEARVLGREDYSMGREADLSPVDLALGWGVMSDSSVLEHIDINQRGRFYYWRVQKFPVPRRQIETQSANMHMIPASDYVEDRLDDVVEGDIIQLRGKLVKVEAADGWRWQSSLTRNDTGGGACELIWVEDFQIKQL